MVKERLPGFSHGGNASMVRRSGIHRKGGCRPAFAGKGTARRGGPGRLTIYTTGDVEEYALRARQVGLERVEQVVCYPPMEL